jgi:hypothetical protein
MLNALQIISILGGFILSIVIAKLLGKYHTKYKAPDSKKIKRNIYKYNNNCYRFIPQVVVGPISNKEYANAYAHI